MHAGKDKAQGSPEPPGTNPTHLPNASDKASRGRLADLGSGRGRALLLASHVPFEQIIGIEVSPQLHRSLQSMSETRSLHHLKSYFTLSAERD
jgi:tRNA G46 methylase TrmB